MNYQLSISFNIIYDDDDIYFKINIENQRRTAHITVHQYGYILIPFLFKVKMILNNVLIAVLHRICTKVHHAYMSPPTPKG